MNKFLLIITLFLAPVAIFSQAQLVINGTTEVTIVEHGGSVGTPIYIEIANPASSAISVTGTKGFIISENQYDYVKWDMATTGGTGANTSYVVPFGYNAGTGGTYYLPVTLAMSAAGTGGTGIKFSTWHTQQDNWTGTTSLTGKPNGVSNMDAMNPGGSPSNTDDSYNVVDRFWTIDATSYTTAPTLGGAIGASAGIQFSYISNSATLADSSEFAGSNNTGVADANESKLLAQRWNTTHSTWGDFTGAAGNVSVNGVSKVATVISGSILPANFFTFWTLSSSIDPLPIQLSSFTAQCDNDSALIQWTSQTELNNDFYTVEKTTDGIHFEVVGKIPGSGTSSLPINYSITDHSPFAGQSYYVLYQTDFDGNQNKIGNPIPFIGCGSNNVTAINAYNTTSYIQVNINSINSNNFNISLINMLGQTIFSGNHAVALGNNEIRLPNNVSSGLYILNVRNSEVNYSQKMVIGVR